MIHLTYLHLTISLNPTLYRFESNVNGTFSSTKIIPTRKKNGFVTATKLGTTNTFFVAATKNFAATAKRFVDRTKYFVVVTKYFCYLYFNI